MSETTTKLNLSAEQKIVLVEFSYKNIQNLKLESSVWLLRKKMPKNIGKTLVTILIELLHPETYK
jgi:accessory colonization factor AcfC